MDSFNIFVLRRVENQFPFFVSLSDKKCIEHARLYPYDMVGLEIAEVAVVSKEFLASTHERLDRILAGMQERLDRIQAGAEAMAEHNRVTSSSLTCAVIKAYALDVQLAERVAELRQTHQLIVELRQENDLLHQENALLRAND